MDDLALNIWLSVGAFLVIIEFLLPGLVMVFVGMGALTVALGMKLGHIDSVVEQLITFFVSSLLYLLTIRFAVLRFIPSDTVQANIDEDVDIIGQVLSVVEETDSLGLARVEHSGSSWQARGDIEKKFIKGDKVKIIRRENITLIVQKILEE